MHRGGTLATSLDTSLIDSLLSPAAFSHSIGAIELIETHISWVILAGDFAYKIKKPIELPFVDFRDLERRRFYCEEEIRLNQPWAPDIYLDVISITMDGGLPRFGGDGAPIEYAVRMRRFDQLLRLDLQLEHDKLTVVDMKELGRNIAARHAAANTIDAEQRERVVMLAKEFIWDNFDALEGFPDDTALNTLRSWTQDELQTVEPLLWQRFDDGYVRDCHGDLHLANLIRLPTGITSFDCIEFSTELRHIDVTCDIAFLIMDLVVRHRADLAAHFLNRYLECTGDYDSMRLLNLYFVYRCLVRAKVAAIRSEERELESEREADVKELNRYCYIALQQTTQGPPTLIVMSGVSGSGKSWVSGQLMAAMPAIRVRSDLERKRMFGLGETERSASDVESGIYTRDASRRIYSHLLDTARTILVAGHNVILDAAFLHEADRALANDVAASCNSACVFLVVSAPIEILRERLLQREGQAIDASEAGLKILEYQLATAEPITDEEKSHAIFCENTGKVDVDELVVRIRGPR